jgi:hypothetical protein
MVRRHVPLTIATKSRQQALGRKRKEVGSAEVKRSRKKKSDAA